MTDDRPLPAAIVLALYGLLREIREEANLPPRLLVEVAGALSVLRSEAEARGLAVAE